MRVLLTALPMINLIEKYDIRVEIPEDLNGQSMLLDKLYEILPEYDAWIIGDDPCPRELLEKCKKLKTIIKWGIGMDNIDVIACKDMNIYVTNTPNMFGEEVSDVAIGYLLMLTRHLHQIDTKVRNGIWYKPIGMSLIGKIAAVIGYGNIGHALVRKLNSFKVRSKIYDPLYNDNSLKYVLDGVDFVFLTCALTETSRHLININTIKYMKEGVILVNVSRGGIIDETALIENIDKFGGCGLDVYEEEPLGKENKLKEYEGKVILGSHNGSNTFEGVDRVSRRVIEIIKNINM